MAQRYGALIVAERNHGGAALLELLEAKMRERGIRVPYREVWASAGKVARAEGPALLAEQGRLHLVGHHPELESELTTFTGTKGERFDRGDAMTWALAELGGVRAGGDAPDVVVVPWSSAPTPGVHRYRHRDPLCEGTDGLEAWERWPGEFGNWSAALDAWARS